MSTSLALPGRRRGRGSRSDGGFTLIELMIVVIIIGILATLGTRGYLSMVNKARNVRAMGDIRVISFAIDDYMMANGGARPPNLTVVGENDRMDPWGRPYVYGPIVGNAGGTRKDKNLVPINTDYDLYSKGTDGKSAPALTAATSRDDIVRAANGGFIGLAENY